MGELSIGDLAPDFSLPGIPGGTYSLSNYLGNVVVLAFYPADNSPVCTTQMRSYSVEEESFKKVNAVVLGISPQEIDSHSKFSSKHNIGIPLLSDSTKEVARQYGVLGPLGFYRRSIFVIDKNGHITYLQRKMAGLTYSPASQLLDQIALAKLN